MGIGIPHLKHALLLPLWHSPPYGDELQGDEYTRLPGAEKLLNSCTTAMTSL